VAAELLETLKTERLKVENWRDKEATRDAVRVAIKDFLYDDRTGLPDPAYNEIEIDLKTDEVYRHVYRVYPTVPSPVFGV
jgi:type I restriction enzyme R subunit